MKKTNLINIIIKNLILPWRSTWLSKLNVNKSKNKYLTKTERAAMKLPNELKKKLVGLFLRRQEIFMPKKEV
jgi:hypothetical protein